MKELKVSILALFIHFTDIQCKFTDHSFADIGLGTVTRPDPEGTMVFFFLTVD